MELEYRPDMIIEATTTFETTGKLILVGGLEPHEWFACSGGWGKGSIPHGIYLLGKPVKLGSTTSGGHAAFRRDGFPWWVPITATRGLGGRGSFGIHPDGNAPGTLGCVGIMQDDLNCFEVLSFAYAKQPKLYLRVY